MLQLLLLLAAARVAGSTPPRRTAMMAWKTCNNAPGCARTRADLEHDFATIQSFGVTHIELYCGFGIESNGSFATIPAPPQRWGVLSICRQAAILIASTPNMSYSIMVEGPLDFNGGLQRVIRDGGARFGAEAAAVLATFPQYRPHPGATPPGVVGLQLDFERGQDKTIPLPSPADFAAMVSGIAKHVPGGVGIAVSQCPYLSHYDQLLENGADGVGVDPG